MQIQVLHYNDILPGLKIHYERMKETLTKARRRNNLPTVYF